EGAGGLVIYNIPLTSYLLSKEYITHSAKQQPLSRAVAARVEYLPDKQADHQRHGGNYKKHGEASRQEARYRHRATNHTGSETFQRYLNANDQDAEQQQEIQHSHDGMSIKQSKSYDNSTKCP